MIKAILFIVGLPGIGAVYGVVHLLNSLGL